MAEEIQKIDYSLCILSSLNSCGSSCKNRTEQISLLKIKNLDRQIPGHSKSTLTEKDVILQRVSAFVKIEKLCIIINEESLICPRHRDYWGVYFQIGSKCYHPSHLGIVRKQKTSVTCASSNLCQWLIAKYHGQFAHGFGICAKHRIEEEHAGKEFLKLLRDNKHEEAAEYIKCFEADEQDTESSNGVREADDMFMPVSNTSLSDVNSMISILDPQISPAKHQLKSPIVEYGKSTISKTVRKYNQAKQAFKRKFLEGIAPGQGDELSKYIDSSESDDNEEVFLTPEIRMLIAAFKRATSNRLKVQLLCAVPAQQYSKKQIIALFQTTKHLVDKSRALQKSDACIDVVPEKHPQSSRLNIIQLDDFLDYLFTSGYIQDVPFGTTSLKCDSGELLVIPHVVRTSIRANIVKSYKQYCKDNDFVGFSERTLYNILDTCKASQRKAMAGLDSYSADGATAFDELHKIIASMNLHADHKTRLKANLESGKQYLKGNYRMHCAVESSCATHCITYSLNDMSNENFKIDCKHQNDDTCKNCENLTTTLEEIGSCLEQYECEEEVMLDLQHDYKNNCDYVLEWQRHVLRTSCQNRAKVHAFENLLEDTVIIIKDWAMKTLPLYYREKMSQFFGKRGMSMETVCCFFKGSKQEKVMKQTYWVVLDQCKQDMHAALSVLDYVLKTLKSRYQHLKTIYMRTDNAGCYSGSAALETEYHIAKNQDMVLLRHDFVEPQTGKDQCDRDNATARRKHRMYVNAGHDITTAEEMKKAMLYEGGISNGHVAVAEMEGGELGALCIPAINNIHSVEYHENHMTVWRYYGIGKGHEVQYKYPSFRSGLVIISDFEEGTVPITTKVKKKKTEVQLLCPEDSCTCVFNDEQDLQGHLISGSHTLITPTTGLDKIKHAYVKRLKTTFVAPKLGKYAEVPSQAHTNLQQISSKISTYSSGWAIRKRKKPIRLTTKQKIFLQECYDIGEKTGSKLTADSVHKLMRTKRTENGKYFGPDEYLTRERIVAFFSHCKAKQNKDEKSEEEDSEECVFSALRDDFYAHCQHIEVTIYFSMY